jgi:hypothetical protein
LRRPRIYRSCSAIEEEEEGCCGHPIALDWKIILKEKNCAQDFEMGSNVPFKFGKVFTIRVVISL